MVSGSSPASLRTAQLAAFSSRFGYTTGSCAAGEARGAAELLLGEDEIGEAELMTPKGILLHLELLDMKRNFF